MEETSDFYLEAPATYSAAEERGFELYKAGEYERAIRMFELAQTLPGDGMDYTREKASGMIGSATAPPNPRGLRLERFATPQQKLIAQYNIACCHAAIGDEPRVVDIARQYLQQVRDPVDAINEMLADPDLASARDGLRVLRGEIKGQAGAGPFGLPSFGNPLRALAEKIDVEWK